MKPFVLLLALLASTATSAQPAPSGAPFSLTETRYGTKQATSHVVASTDSDTFVFWAADANIRATKVVDGERRAGRNVLEVQPTSLAAAWNGSSFLLVARSHNAIVARPLDRSGEPIGEPFVITQFGEQVRLASNGRSFFLLYSFERVLYGLELNRAGVPVNTPKRLFEAPAVQPTYEYDVASNGAGYAVAISTGREVRVLTLDLDGNEVAATTVYSTTIPDSFARTPNVASSGRGYAVAWSQWDGGASIVALSPHGEAGQPIRIGDRNRMYGDVRVVWSSTTWMVSSWGAPWGGAPSEVVVEEIDEPVMRQLGLWRRLPGVNAQLGVTKGRVSVVWQKAPGAIPVAVPLLARDAAPTDTTLGAASQNLGPIAWSNDATLVSWTERVGYELLTYAGIRTREGIWVEKRLSAGPNGAPMLAASDGHTFLLVLRNGMEAEALFLNDRAQETAQRVPLPFRPVGVAWDGSHYLLLSDGVAVWKLSPNGTLSAPVVVAPEGTEPQSIASNGSISVVSWIEPAPCGPITCGYFGGAPHAIAIGRNLERLSAQNLLDSEDLVDHVEVVWDGKRFLALWSNGKIVVVRVPVSGGSQQPVAVIEPGERSYVAAFHTAVTPAGVAVAAVEPGAGGPRYSASLVHHDNRTSRLTLASDVRMATVPRIAPLANGLLFLGTNANFAAPYHGSQRVFAQVSSVISTTAPEAPTLDVTASAHGIRLTWTAPAQQVDAYRVEYRVADGVWNELENVFNAEQRSFGLPWTVPAGVAVRFRVRAINEAGPGEYSRTAGINTSRRRAVR
ncbi:MAG TPA: fibronectin type III domain-containing protein [Thermoanaerobaculia bacterium]|jgi:hypothetical protein